MFLKFALTFVTFTVLAFQKSEGRVNFLNWKNLTDLLGLQGIFQDSVQGCEFDLNKDLTEPQPLFVKVGSTEFVNPLPNGVVQFKKGETVELFCSTSFKSPFEEIKQIVAECIGANTYLVNGRKSYLEDFVCKNNVNHMARRSGKKCAQDSSHVEVGFKTEDERFLKVYELCHNEDQQATLYVYHKLNPSSASYQKSVTRPNFIEGDFYEGANVDNLYKQKVQMETIGGILGSGHEQYFDEKKSFFLARGHLAAKTDVIFGAHQRATFYFLNAAPQWQRFNAGNWERVEAGVREFVAQRKIEVDCYTGTWGIMELPDMNGRPQQLFLDFDENNNGRIPVPKIYFRVVYQPETKLGIVFIGVNNPHASLEEIEESYILCEDISDQINWVNWKRDDISSGYSYACEVNDFQASVDYVPDLDVVGLLH